MIVTWVLIKGIQDITLKHYKQITSVKDDKKKEKEVLKAMKK